MPEIVSLEVDPMQVRKGDLVDDATSADLLGGKTVYQHGHMVESTKTGQANTVIETTGGKIVIRNTGTVIVRREQPTQAELDAKAEEMLDAMRADVIDRVNKFVAGAARARTAAVEKIAAAQRTDHWDMDAFLSANAQVKVAQLVGELMDRARDQKLHVHEGDCNHVSTPEGYRCTIETRPTTEWDGVVHVFKVLTRQLMETATRRRVLSRSTSLTSNIMEDLEAEVLANFFGEFRYGLAVGKLGLTSPYTVGADF